MASLRYAVLLSLSIAQSLSMANCACGNGSETQAVDASSVLAANNIDKASATKGGANGVSGWRRTATGWENTDDWTTSSSSTGETRATNLHPGLIAAFVVLVSLGGLLAFDPLFRRRRLVKSDKALIQNWGVRLRRATDSYDCL